VIKQHPRHIQSLILDSRKPQQFPQFRWVEEVLGCAYIKELNQFHVSNGKSIGNLMRSRYCECGKCRKPADILVNSSMFKASQNHLKQLRW
jgi:hypothetical protein